MTSQENQKKTEKLFKEIRLPIFSFKKTQEAALQNSNILNLFQVKMGETMRPQKRSLLDYGSEFRVIKRINRIFSHLEYKDKIVGIIPTGSHCNLYLIEKATRQYPL